ncbi:MAG: FAD-binding oxidoreductase [Cyanobacteria bacterium J06632_22]
MNIAAQLAEKVDGATVVPWAEVSSEQQAQVMSALCPPTEEGRLASPDCIVFPETTAALSQVMTLAAEHGWRVLPTGQGSKLGWGGLADGVDVVICTANLNRVIDHAVGDFTVTVEPGLKLADLQEKLAAHRQFLAVDPAFSAQATVGGIVATADAGSLRQRYGGIRDMLIGVQFVRHDGEVAKAGGRVVKNVAGYDLMKLMTGAYGSLGIISELTFRLYPVQAVSRTLVVSGGETALEQAIAEVRLSGLTPVALDLTLARTAAKTAAAVAGDSLDGAHMSLLARFQGIADGVDEQTVRLQKIATTHGMSCLQLDGEADQQIWQQVGELVNPDTVLCKVGMRPSALPALLAYVETKEAVVWGYGSSGLGWVQWPAARTMDDELKVEMNWVRSHCQQNGGFLTLLQGPVALKQSVDVWGYTGNALQVMSDIKQKFDPKKLLSPGRFVGGL